MHTINDDGLIRKTLDILDRSVVKKLINEKDKNGDDVCQRSMKLGLNSWSDAKRWIILTEYEDEHEENN